MQKLDRKICETTLRLAARYGWDKVTLDAVGKAGKVPLGVFQKRFADTVSLLPLLVDYGTECTLAACDPPMPSMPMRDRTFDVLMARFDYLQTHRKAILSIAMAAQRDPKTALILCRSQAKAMKRIEKFVGLGQRKGCSNLYSHGLLVIFWTSFRVWRNDETIDMSKTMAMLDRSLRLANDAARLFRGDLPQ